MMDIRKNIQTKNNKLVCPKCSQLNGLDAEYCWKCYYDFIPDKSQQKKQVESTSVGDAKQFGEGLKVAHKLIIQQKKEWTEILTNWETRNRYSINALGTSDVYEVWEQGTGIGKSLVRQLGRMRPYTVSFMDRGIPFMTISRPFTFFLSRVKVTMQERELGTIRQCFSILKKIYVVVDNANSQLAKIVAPLFHPWTFKVIDYTGREVGQIQKRWSGLGTEMFTDADKFTVNMDNVPEGNILRNFMLAAAIVIDLDFFEKSGSRK